MHMLDVGHVCDSLLIEGNLYRFSQQGWEAINKKFRKIFFNQTAMGGGRGGSNSKLLPVFYFFLREMYWKFGWADNFFTKYVYPRAEGAEYTKLNIRDCYDRPTKLNNHQIELIAKALVAYDPSVEGFDDSEAFAEILESVSEEEEQRILNAFIGTSASKLLSD